MGCGFCRNHRIETLKIANAESLNIDAGLFVVKNENCFHEEYKVGKVLGSGAFGEVRRAIHRESGEIRAVKIFRKDLAQNEASQRKLREEIDILRSLDHPNIIRVYEYFEDSKKFYIVMEKCNGGELFEEIIKRQNFGESHAATILQQLFSTLAYLHDRKIIHRDIKPENILLEESHDIMNIKLIDFGTAVRLKDSTVIHGAIGTAYYIAPEVLSGTYNSKCDIWSCGVLIYILLAGHPPFDGQSDEEILSKVEKSNYNFKHKAWKSVTPEAKDLISSLLAPSSTRLTAHQALSHPWIQKYSQKQETTKCFLDLAVSNLQGFHKGSKLRDAVNTFIVSQCVSIADTKELRKVFKTMDKNGDGKLSKEELFEYFSGTMGREQAEEEVKRIMAEVDGDNSGFVDYTEFIKATFDYRKMANIQFLKRAFDLFDTNGSGTISAMELKKILAGGNVCEDSIWSEIIKKVDINGDGEIDFGEFEKIILKKYDEI